MTETGGTQSVNQMPEDSIDMMCLRRSKEKTIHLKQEVVCSVLRSILHRPPCQSDVMGQWTDKHWPAQACTPHWDADSPQVEFNQQDENFLKRCCFYCDYSCCNVFFFYVYHLQL